MRFVSLGHDRPRFSVEIMYPREDRDFVLIYLGLWIFMYIWRHMICSLTVCFQINLLYPGHRACLIGGDWSFMLIERVML